MPLVATSRGVSVRRCCIFILADEQKTVRVDVGTDLLARLKSTSAALNETHAQQLARRKRLFAQIAGARYEQGQYESEVKVLVVKITEADLA